MILAGTCPWYVLSIKFWNIADILNYIECGLLNMFCSFEMWFDVERLSIENAEEKIVKEEQQKNILSMLHQVFTSYWIMLCHLKDTKTLCNIKKVFVELSQINIIIKKM